MKISELLKKIGIDLDSEIDDDTEKDITMNKDGNKKESNVDNNLADAKLNNDKEETKMAFKAPKVDKNGFYDLSDIEDADMKEFFKARNLERKAELDARKVEDDKKVVNDAIPTNKPITMQIIIPIILTGLLKPGQQDSFSSGDDDVVGTSAVSDIFYYIFLY